MEHLLDLDNEYDAALRVLTAGGLVAVPTETVYGLAANACDGKAVARIYAAKGRPGFNPLISHVADLEMAQKFGLFDEISLTLAEKFWPGPLTLVVPLKPDCGIDPAVVAGLDTIALRQPLGIMADLAKGLGNPIAAPSANSSGKISPTLASHVLDDLGEKVDVILDDGPCTVGVESTILKITDRKAVLLRQGGITKEALEAVIGPIVTGIGAEGENGDGIPEIEAPGMLLAHYAPNKPVRLNASHVDEDEALLYMGPMTTDGYPLETRNLSLMNDLEEAARNLFAMLKELDKTAAKAIAVEPISQKGLGAAINDRLKRAAHGSNQK